MNLFTPMLDNGPKGPFSCLLAWPLISYVVLIFLLKPIFGDSYTLPDYLVATAVGAILSTVWPIVLIGSVIMGLLSLFLN